MSTEQVSEITCDICLRASIITKNKGSFIRGSDNSFYSYQDVDICQHCCFVLQRSRMFPSSIIGTIIDNYNDTLLKANTNG